MEISTLRPRLILLNILVSGLLGVAGVALVIYGEIGLSSLGYPGFILLFLPIPIIILSDAIVQLLLRNNLKIFFNYYFITRLLLVVILAFSAYNDVSDGKGGSDVVPIIAVAWVSLCALTVALLQTYTLLQFRLRKLFLIICFVTVLLSIYFIFVSTGVINNSWSAAKKDTQISYDFHLLSQDIQGMALVGDAAAPQGTAKELAERGMYGKEFNIASRADAYQYIPLDDGSFILCATFGTNTTDDARYQNKDYIREDENYHQSGYQCINYVIHGAQRKKSR